MDTEKKTIAKNTTYLYISSILQLFLGLYTSRVLLQTLGVSDFGLYGVVGSIVTLLSFLNLALGSSSSRYLTYELANGNISQQTKVYSAVFGAHLILAIGIVILAETIGLWYICNKLVIPQGRFTAALYVYQTSVFIGFINIIQVPYNALVNAHEKMGFSSWWNSLNNILKFVGVISLYWVTFDKLIYYSILMLFLNLFVFVGFWQYCQRNFIECRIVKNIEKSLFRGILTFAGYSTFSSSSYLIRSQGITILINKFFGVIMNASANIANMVSGYITNFTQNVITAFRPQIIKSYAQGEIAEMQNNINLCMKACIAIYSLMAIPIGIDMKYILTLWLGNVPTSSDLFCRIALCGNLFGLINMVILVGIQATSKIKTNSLLISLITLFSLIITFILLLIGMNTYIVFVMHALTEFIIMMTSMFNLKKLIPHFKMSQCCLLITRLLFVILIAASLTTGILFCIDSSFIRLVIVTICYTFIFGILFWYSMLDRILRQNILNRVYAFFKNVN